MDIIGYAAFGGLERVAIIAGALLVGYWGYLLYVREKSAGLVFMGIACLVLLGSLLTGNNHVKSVGESVQLASGTDPGTLVVDEKLSDAAVTRTIERTAGNSQTSPPQSSEGAGARGPVQSGTVSSTDDVISASSTAPSEAEASVWTSNESAASPADGNADFAAGSAAGMDEKLSELVGEDAEDVSLASAQELGGRIVSVKSKNVSLEWTTPEP